METLVADIVSDLPPPLASGRVGFFWIVPDRFGKDALLAESIKMLDAEVYGEALTHPGGHYEFWDAMMERGTPWLRNRRLSAELLNTEYDEWPRGRVVFRVNKLRFDAMADRRLHTSYAVSMIARAFRLPTGHYDVSADNHYRTKPFR